MASLQQFTEKVLSVSPQYISIVGTGVPGIAGTSGAGQGASSGSATTLDLQRATAEFAQAYTDQKVELETVKTKAQAVEASILTLQTVSTLSEKEASQLIDELYDLVDERSKQ